MDYSFASDDASGTALHQVDDAEAAEGEEADDDDLFSQEDELLQPPDVFTTIHR